MSAGGSFNPSANSSGGPIDNQQRLQTSPNPSLPPADYSMGYARNFQPPSFFNPFSGYYGANTGMGGFQQPQYGGFQQPQYGGFGGFGGFQQPQYGGFQQPQYGGFQQPFGGGFQQPFMPQRPQMPPDFGGGFGLRQGVMPPPRPYDPRAQMPTIPNRGLPDDVQFLPQPQPATRAEGDASSGGSLFSSFASTQPTTPSGIQRPDIIYHTGAFRPNFGGDGGGRVTDDYRGGMGPGLRQFTQPQNPFPPETQKAYAEDRAKRGLSEEVRMTDYPEYWERMAKKEQPNWTKSSSPSLMGNFGGFDPMMGGGIGAFGGRGFMGYR